MPGDPKECRIHAFHCAELAGDARNPQLKSTFLELAANWQKLAQDLEHTQQLLAQEAAEVALAIRRPEGVQVSA
jgi:hypothetical protein